MPSFVILKYIHKKVFSVSYDYVLNKLHLKKTA